jgi:hypothetical protein
MSGVPTDVLALAERLLAGVPLIPGQLAQIRALNSRYYTQLFALQERVRAARGADASPSAAERAALLAPFVEELRQLIGEEHRAALERNLERLPPWPAGG